MIQEISFSSLNDNRVASNGGLGRAAGAGGEASPS